MTQKGTQMAKTYVKGSAKRRTTNFGDIIKLSFKAEELAAFVRQHANQKGYIAFDIVERKEPGQYGDTHSIVLDDWQPSTPSTGAGARQDEQRYEPRQPAQSQGDGFRGGPIDDREIPF
jgi:hypothetical protein